MECKNCGAFLNEEDRICTACGQEVPAEEQMNDDVQEAAEAVEEETVDVTVSAEAETETATESDEEAAGTEETAEIEEPAAKKNTGLVIALIACLAAIIVLVVLLISGKTGNKEEKPGDSAQIGADDLSSSMADVTETVYVPEVSYVIDDAAAFDEALLSQVVATCGDITLDNEILTYYYWREFYSFLNIYSNYITMMMQPYERLDQQEAVLGGLSWDEMFMESAMESFHTYAAACQKGRESGYELSAEEQEGLDAIAEEMAGYAQNYGYESADAYIQQSFGPNASLESYQAFMADYIYGASYLDYCLNNAEVTKEEVIAFYEENKDEYDASGLVMDDRPMVNIRHILIQPAVVEVSKDDPGYEAAEQAAWDEAKAQAEAIYAQWQEGEMTEESFAELAKEHSTDGSAMNGGLIEEIAPGQTVENFDMWCFEEGRAVGNHGLVETEFGYHIIYFSGVCEESYWYRTMLAEYQNELYMRICTGLRDQYALEKNLSKAAVYPVNVDIGRLAQ